jgi:hypothetical protein
MELTPRIVSLLALLALVPAAAFVVLGSEFVAAVAAVNVVLIAASLALALSPHESEHDEPDDPRPDGA